LSLTPDPTRFLSPAPSPGKGHLCPRPPGRMGFFPPPLVFFSPRIHLPFSQFFPNYACSCTPPLSSLLFFSSPASGAPPPPYGGEVSKRFLQGPSGYSSVLPVMPGCSFPCPCPNQLVIFSPPFVQGNLSFLLIIPYSGRYSSTPQTGRSIEAEDFQGPLYHRNPPRWGVGLGVWIFSVPFSSGFSPSPLALPPSFEGVRLVRYFFSTRRERIFLTVPQPFPVGVSSPSLGRLKYHCFPFYDPPPFISR